MSKGIKHICKKCQLYNPTEQVCGITVMAHGEELELATKPEDYCHWERHGLLDKIKSRSDMESLIWTPESGVSLPTWLNN